MKGPASAEMIDPVIAKMLVAVDGASEQMGVHGRAWFRFGRPEPVAPNALPTGPNLIINGRNFGAAVPATQ